MKPNNQPNKKYEEIQTARGKRPEYPDKLFPRKVTQIMPFNSPADPTSEEKPPSKCPCVIL